MDKNTFIKKLDDRLRFLADSDRKDILYDYEEHITAAVENGENEAEVIDKLGSPELIARQYHAAKMIKEAESQSSPRNLLRALLATMGLGMLNLIFVLGPFVALIGVLIGLLGSGIAIAISGILIAGSGLLGLTGLDLHWVIHTSVPISFNQSYLSLAMVGGGISIFSAGGLMTLAGVWLSEQTFKITIRYLKFNMRLITGEAPRHRVREV